MTFDELFVSYDKAKTDVRLLLALLDSMRESGATVSELDPDDLQILRDIKGDYSGK